MSEEELVMDMKRCPQCGEKYSDTYQHCPFCEEETSSRRGQEIRRSSHGGKRATRHSQPSLLSPILVVVILLLAALLIYLLFGDKIAEKFAPKDPVTPPPVEEITPPEPNPSEGGDVEMPSDPTVPEQPERPADEINLDKLPNTLTVNNADFTLKAGESFDVKVTSGGSGPYTWSSGDDGVASVDANGKVTAISKGKVIITVHDGTGKGSATVYVKGTAAPGGTTAPATGPAKLSIEDFTQPVGSPDVKLTVSGTTAAITWDAEDPKVATVTENGTVHAVGRGTTTVTATYDGKVLKCIVRVP